MKIVIAALSAPLAMNGVSRHAANLVGALCHTKSISEIHFIAGTWQKNMFRQIWDTADTRLHTHWVTPGDGNFRRLKWYYRELPQVAAQLEADVVHFACPAPMARAAFRCSTVVSLHDLYPFEIPENFGVFRSIMSRSLMSQCIQRADAIACVSQHTRRNLERWFPDESSKAVTIANIIEPPPCARLDSCSAIPVGRNFLLCVAQHRRNKNIPLAILVLSVLIRKRWVPFHTQLVVVGIPGPETRTIRNLIGRLNLGQNVLLLSGLSESELQLCYRHARVLLAPSRTEGFGLPVGEALLAGCPVVCSDIPAFREVGKSRCHYVRPGEGELQRYVDAVRQVLAEARPQPISMPEYSSPAIGREYADLYARITCCGASGFWYATATRRSTPSGVTRSIIGKM